MCQIRLRQNCPAEVSVLKFAVRKVGTIEVRILKFHAREIIFAQVLVGRVDPDQSPC